jgi:hypothetical protein
LAGVQLPIAEQAQTIGVAVAIAMTIRVVAEEFTAWAFPDRLNRIHPDEVPSPHMVQRFVAIVLRGVAFYFVAGALVGNTWHLAVGTALFVIPSLVSLWEDHLPNAPWLYQLLPAGLPGLALSLFVATSTVRILTDVLGATPDLARISFVLIPVPGVILSLLGTVGRAPSNGDVRWYLRQRNTWIYRIGGLLVLAAVLHMTGVL